MDEARYELHPGDGLFPATVLELSDVPQTLFVRGDPEVLSTPALSIIGARKASPDGDLGRCGRLRPGVGLGRSQCRRQTCRGVGDRRRCGLPALECGAHRAHDRYGRRGRVHLALGYGAT